jgi:DNA-binding MurR/RpiR family transcriptional regulator
MEAGDLRDQILSTFETLPGQLQAAAKRLLDHPEDVALLSMRELAKRAEVPPATMTRLARRLGFDGFEPLRKLYADAVRGRPDTFKDRAEGLLARRDMDGDAVFVADMLAGLASHLQSLSDPHTASTISRAADLIVRQHRLFCVGARSSYPAMHLGSYLLSLIGEQTFLVDGAGGIGVDGLRSLTPSDAVLALTVAPYTRDTVDAVAFASERGAAIIAITDSLASPIARHAKEAILVPTGTPSFLHTMTPAFVVVECLAALVAAKRGKSAVAAIAEAEDHLDRFGSYVRDRPRRKGRT